LFEDDCVMILSKNPFTMSPLQARYDAGMQRRISSILTKLYTREHLLRSVGSLEAVERMYRQAAEEKGSEPLHERLCELEPQARHSTVHKDVMKEKEFEMKLHDKFLGGAYNPSFLSMPDELWAKYLRAYERVSRERDARRGSTS